MSVGKPKVSRVDRCTCLATRTRSSFEEPKNGLPLILVATSELLHRGGAPVSYLLVEPMVPAAACEMAVVFRSARCAYFTCRVLPTVNGQKSELKPHFTAKLRLLTHPPTFLLVKQPQIFNDGNY